MDKMINCSNWKEYQGMNGWIMFCSAGAYGRKLTVTEARSCGCTELQREKCKNLMENNVGFGLVPEIYEEAMVVERQRDREPLVHRI